MAITTDVRVGRKNNIIVWIRVFYFSFFPCLSFCVLSPNVCIHTHGYQSAYCIISGISLRNRHMCTYHTNPTCATHLPASASTQECQQTSGFDKRLKVRWAFLSAIYTVDLVPCVFLAQHMSQHMCMSIPHITRIHYAHT